MYVKGRKKSSDLSAIRYSYGLNNLIDPQLDKRGECNYIPEDMVNPSGGGSCKRTETVLDLLLDLDL